MRFRLCIVLGLLALFAAAGLVAAQFGPAPQPIYAPGTGPYTAQPARDADGRNLGWTWREYRSQPGTHYLHDNFGRRVGAFRASTFEYWPLVGNAYGAACRPPCDLPRVNALPVVPERPTMNFGLDLSRIGKHGQRYLVGGKQVSRKQAFEAIQKGELLDDSGKLRVTVFGSPERTKAVAEAIKADAVGQKVHVQQYRPDDAMIRGLGFKLEGDPTVYVQEPAGRVRHRSRGATTAADAVAAVRKAADGYNPSRDPNLNSPLGGGSLAGIPNWAWLAAGLALVYIVLSDKKGAPRAA